MVPVWCVTYVLSLSIMRKVEEIALRERHGEVQVEVPVEIAAFMLNENVTAWYIWNKLQIHV